MAYASKLIEVAESQVGYLEKASPYNLDSFTGNAGYNNYTKYARDLYNEIGSPFVNGYAWCMSFVTWCFVKAFGLSEAKKLLGGWTAYCPTAVNYFCNMGRFQRTNPKKGDVIFFYDSEGDAGHVGIVYAVDSTTVYTIEGNTSSSSGVVPNGGGVYKKSYSINYSRIYGYGRPDYETEKSNWVKTEKGWRYKSGNDFARNKWLNIDGKDYYFKANGYMAADEYVKSSDYNNNGILYYLGKDGVWDGYTYKWHQNKTGWWIERDSDGWYPTLSWAVIDGKTYRFDSKGYIVQNRTVTIDGKKYTFDKNGVLKE